MMAKMTIKDIAKLAGVSVSTVSLVLSNHGYVSAKTRRRVERIIAKHNYHPRQTARNLVSGRTGNMGFIISDIHLSGTEFFYSRVLLGAELEARKKDYYLLVTTVGDTFQPPQDAPRFLKGGDVDGVIIAGSVPEELVSYIHPLNIPYVLVDYKHPSIDSNLVQIENHDGACQAVEHLLRHGYRRIAFVGGSCRHASIRERFRGYQDTLYHAGLSEVAQDETLHFLVTEETTGLIGARGINALLDRAVQFDAVVCANDTTALGCLNALQERGLDVPGDMAVIGFDDIRYAVETKPTLTTVHVPKLEMGIQAVRLLFECLENPGGGLYHRSIGTELMVRESTNRVPVETGAAV
ncbi:MAG: LacI family DNA-binding transcriptional regulator [Candidatus Marinimicrobia bacterium]|nr:LacI family DNA-binding transcriptional regulator [Candidatus Neomarinimicrobiota bacterium]